MNPSTINEVIKNRRAIFPKTYNNEPIPKEIVEQILENANWAPTHKRTEPWRFKVITGAANLEKLGKWLSASYKTKFIGDKFSPKKFEKLTKNPTLASHVIAICMQRDSKERIPEIEEVSAVASAVQNMWLTATAYNIGAYWSSPGLIYAPDFAEFLGLEEGQSCLGLFYMGYHNLPQIEGKREPIGNKVEWLEL